MMTTKQVCEGRGISVNDVASFDSGFGVRARTRFQVVGRADLQATTAKNPWKMAQLFFMNGFLAKTTLFSIVFRSTLPMTRLGEKRFPR